MLEISWEKITFFTIFVVAYGCFIATVGAQKVFRKMFVCKCWPSKCWSAKLGPETFGPQKFSLQNWDPQICGPQIVSYRIVVPKVFNQKTLGQQSNLFAYLLPLLKKHICCLYP